MACVTWCSYEGSLPDKDDPDSKLRTWGIILATFSNWFRNEILGIMEGETPVIPTQLYVAVHSTTCSSAVPGTELTGDGYARVPITFERVSDIKRWNPADVTTPAASALWPTVHSFSLWDSAVEGGGNYYAYGNLTTAISIDANYAIKWPANKVIVGLGSAVT